MLVSLGWFELVVLYLVVGYSSCLFYVIVVVVGLLLWVWVAVWLWFVCVLVLFVFSSLVVVLW